MSLNDGYNTPGILTPASTGCAAARDKAPDRQNNYGTHNRTNEASAFIRAIPAKRLAEKGRNKRSNDAKNGRENKTRGLVLARHDQLGSYTRYKTDDNRPNDAHGPISRVALS